MSEKDSFMSVAELGFNGHSIGMLATAIEEVGFYTWDRFGRYVHIPPKEEDVFLIKIRNRVLDELAKGRVAEEKEVWEDVGQEVEGVSEFFYGRMIGPTPLSLSGWPESKLPDFEQLHKDWSQQHAGIINTPKSPGPAPQSKIWAVLVGLLKLKYKDEVIEDLSGKKSKKASMIRDQLATKGVNIDPKTLKGYIAKANKD